MFKVSMRGHCWPDSINAIEVMCISSLAASSCWVRPRLFRIVATCLPKAFNSSVSLVISIRVVNRLLRIYRPLVYNLLEMRKIETKKQLSDHVSARLMLAAKRLIWRKYNFGLNPDGKYFLEYETSERIERIHFDSKADFEAHVDNLIIRTSGL